MLAEKMDAAKTRRVEAAARLLSSDKAGEREAALSALARLLPGDLLATVIAAGLARSRSAARSVDASDAFKRWQRLAQTIRCSPLPLAVQERRFLADLVARSCPPTDRQRAYLQSLAERLRAWEGRDA